MIRGDLNRELDPMDVAWAVRRLPTGVRDLLKAHPAMFLAGGYLRAVVAGERVSDFDLFVPTKDHALIAAGELAGEDHKVHETDNAYTVRTRPVATQFIHRWTFATPLDALASFDFTIAQAAVWWDGRWHSACSSRFYSDLAAKRLVYTSPQRNEDAGGSMLRVLKFYQRGYRIPLDSLGAVVARLCGGVEGLVAPQKMGLTGEACLSKLLTALLVEVDPLVDPDHIAHLPDSTTVDGTEQEVAF